MRAERQSIGTGHGAREWAPVSSTAFERATRTPVQVTTLRYDSVDALVARFGEDWRPSDLRLRHMRSRWGSCSRDGRMTLSTQLMHVPPACRDYVICHEMSHLREFNHGPRFYAWQEHLCPDWRARRDDMKQWAERLRGG